MLKLTHFILCLLDFIESLKFAEEATNKNTNLEKSPADFNDFMNNYQKPIEPDNNTTIKTNTNIKTTQVAKPQQGFGFLNYFNRTSQPQPQSQSQPNPNKVYRMLILGETGSGKSTLINTMTNYLRDGSLKNLKVAIPTMYLKTTEEFKNSEFDVKNNGKSQTKEPIEYKFNIDDEQICILDTPGLCDTEGLEKDNENLEKIVNSAIKIDKLSGIILVMNGTNSRVNNNIKHVLNKFNGFFPDSVMKNIIVVFTCCREETCNFKSLDKLGIKPHKVIYMNNSAFSVDPRKYNLEADQITNIEWNKSMEMSKNIVNELKSLSTTSTFEFAQMFKIRNSIKSKLHDSKLKIIELQKIQDEYQQAKNAADIHGATSEQFKNYTIKKTVEKEVFEETPYHSTICGKCNKVCHSHCGLEEIKNKDNSSAISNCACFRSNNLCQECGCDPSTHYHDRKDLVLKMVTLDEELTDIKNKST